MLDHKSTIKIAKISAIFSSLIIFASVAGMAYFRQEELRVENERMGERISILEKTIHVTNRNLSSSTEENQNLEKEKFMLAENLQTEQSRNNQFQSQFNELSGTVGVLKKLSETDKELLMKYSKVYFLNDNYTPSSLAIIDPKYQTDSTKSLLIHTNVLPFLNQMIQAASTDGVDLKIISAYRSFAEQAAIKTGYKVTYGSGANKFSADQGYSEHQLGTTLDLTDSKTAPLSAKFESSDGYKWLQANAHKYGFILSYPKNNSYYVFEPWHWRFVGRYLANDLRSLNQSFYEMSQRQIDTYLIKVFD